MGDIYKHMGEKLKKFERVKQALPVILGNQAVNYFQDSFRKGGFDNTKWPEVQRRIPETNSYRYPKKKGLGRRTRGILINKGKLRRDVRLRLATFSKILVSTSLPYASVHNKGTNRIKRRRFMGRSPILRRMHSAKIKQLLKTI